MRPSYITAHHKVEQHSVNAARERILLGAAIADLREMLHHQQSLLLALVELLDERGLLDQGEVMDRGKALSALDLPHLPLEE